MFVWTLLINFKRKLNFNKTNMFRNYVLTMNTKKSMFSLLVIAMVKFICTLQTQTWPVPGDMTHSRFINRMINLAVLRFKLGIVTFDVTYIPKIDCRNLILWSDREGPVNCLICFLTVWLSNLFWITGPKKLQGQVIVWRLFRNCLLE